MQFAETRVLDDASQYSQYDRASRFIEMLSGIDIDVRDKHVADLGTGFGSIAMASARHGASYVVAVDAHPQRIAEVEHRANSAGLSIDPRVANLLAPLPDVPSVDIALLIGVVEYAGLWDNTAGVDSLQLKIIQNAYRILKPGGVLILATKNRLWPPFALKDLHTQQPLVNILPRRAADYLSLKTSGKPYREHIHTPSGWSDMIKEAGFSSVSTYYPFFNYQFPLLIMERPNLESYRILDLGTIPEEIRAAAIGKHTTAKAILMTASRRVGIPLSQSLIFRAVK